MISIHFSFLFFLFVSLRACSQLSGEFLIVDCMILDELHRNYENTKPLLNVISKHG
jgi:hypothetical protein